MTDPHTLPPLSFAPLEGITGWIFRQVHHAMFPGLSRYYTPFFAPTADSPLTGRGLRDMHPDHNRGVPVVPQLLTNRAEDFIASARLLLVRFCFQNSLCCFLCLFKFLVFFCHHCIC